LQLPISFCSLDSSLLSSVVNVLSILFPNITRTLTLAWQMIFHAPTYIDVLPVYLGRAMAPAVTLVRAQVKSYEICGERIGTVAGFLPVFRVALLILSPPTAPHSPSSIILGWYNRPISSRRTKWTHSHSTPIN
jgi:hypothetical protein